MRICPTCADQVAVTLRYCPRCTTLLPEPGYRPEPGYYSERGHYPGPRHYADPGHYAEPDYDAEPGYPTPPGYPAGPGYSGLYLPAPYADAPDQPVPYVASPYQPDQYEAPYQPGQYEAPAYQPGQYEAAPYQPDQYEVAPYHPGPGERVRGELDRYGEVPYEDDPDDPDPFGDRFAGGGPETAVSPARPARAPVAGGEWAGNGRTRLPGCSIHRPARRARPGGR